MILINGTRIVLYSILVTLPKDQFNQENWDKVYGDMEIESPLNRPQEQGNTVKITMFVNAAFAGDIITWNLHT